MSETCLWRRFAAALIAAAAFGTAAQPAPPASPPASPGAATASPGQPAMTPYRSAFDKYQPFTDATLVPWKDANVTVGAIGGWRAYAKEASETPAAPQSATGSSAHPHSGHAKP